MSSSQQVSVQLEQKQQVRERSTRMIGWPTVEAVMVCTWSRSAHHLAEKVPKVRHLLALSLAACTTI